MPRIRLKSSLATASVRHRCQRGRGRFDLLLQPPKDLPGLLDQPGRSGRPDQLDLGHRETGTMNDLDERDGPPQGFGQDDSVECGE